MKWKKIKWILLDILFVSVVLFLLLRPLATLRVTSKSSKALLDAPMVIAPETFEEEEIVPYSEAIAKEASEHLDELPVGGQISMPDAIGMHVPILEGNTNWNTVVGAATQKPNQVIDRKSVV